MNEQQMEAVEHLVESGVFPKGLIAITEPPNPAMETCQVYFFVSRGKIKLPNDLNDLYLDILSIRDEDDGEEWKQAEVL